VFRRFFWGLAFPREGVAGIPRPLLKGRALLLLEAEIDLQDGNSISKSDISSLNYLVFRRFFWELAFPRKGVARPLPRARALGGMLGL
jgi:hypothetical protein